MKKELKVSLEKTPVTFLKVMSVLVILIGIAGSIIYLTESYSDFYVIIGIIWLIISLAFGAILRGIAYIVECKHIEREISAQDYEIKFKKHKPLL